MQPRQVSGCKNIENAMVRHQINVLQVQTGTSARSSGGHARPTSHPGTPQARSWQGEAAVLGPDLALEDIVAFPG
jgi:hypothetical protein